jgi:hypothetical protein
LSTPDPDFQMVVSVKPQTLAVAFASGALVTLATVAAAAYRTSRMSMAAAIRDLPEPASGPRRQWPRRVLLVLLVAVGAVSLVQPEALARLGGGVALIAAATALTRGRLPDRGRATMTGLLLAAWAAIVSGGNPVADSGRFIAVFVLAGVVGVFGLCIVAAANLRLLEAGLGLAGARFGRMQAALRPPVAYLSRRPLPTGLATGTFALVIVLVTVIAGMVSGSRPAYARDSAGYDIRVVSVGPDPVRLPSDVEREVTAQATIPMRRYVGPIHSPDPLVHSGESVSLLFYDMSDELLATPPIYPGSLDQRFGSPAQVWRAMGRDPSLVVLCCSVTPGSDVTLQGTAGPLRLTIAGSPGAPILAGAVVSDATLARIPTRPAGSTLLLRTKPGADPRVLARRIERSLFSQGVDATTTRELVYQGSLEGLSWITLFDLLLHMGLLVGVLSLAVVGIRAAVERRRAIGIMRSLGYQPPRLLAGLVAEAALTATIGVVIGIGAGVAMTYLAATRFSLPGTTFGIDGGRMGVALAIVYGTTLTVTAALGWRAARMPPADAIRHTG